MYWLIGLHQSQICHTGYNYYSYMVLQSCLYTCTLFTPYVQAANLNLCHPYLTIPVGPCSSVAMNVFVCSVKSYSEVSSRDYLVASDKCLSSIWKMV